MRQGVLPTPPGRGPDDPRALRLDKGVRLPLDTKNTDPRNPRRCPAFCDGPVLRKAPGDRVNPLKRRAQPLEEAGSRVMVAVFVYAHEHTEGLRREPRVMRVWWHSRKVHQDRPSDQQLLLGSPGLTGLPPGSMRRGARTREQPAPPLGGGVEEWPGDHCRLPLRSAQQCR